MAFLPAPESTLVALLRQAQAQRAAGDNAGAILTLEQAASRAPGNALVRHDLGQLLLESGRAEAALSQFDHAIVADPNLGMAHFRRGIALEMLGRPGFADAYRRAIQNAPDLAEPYACLASAEEQDGRRAAALALYRQARARTEAGTTRHLVYQSHALLLENDLDGAEKTLRAILAREPHLARPRALLANILHARGDFAAAAAEIETALRQKPTDVSLYYTLVQARQLTQQDSALIDRMRAAKQYRVPARARIRLHLALARGLDALGDWPSALAELREADLLRLQHSKFDPDRLALHTDRMIELFTQSYLGHPAHRRSQSELPILVIGLPRSGTTLVEQILSLHTSIEGAGELAFWDSTGAAILAALRPGEAAVMDATCESYLARLRDVSPGASRVVDKNPFNYRWAVLAHLAFPRARIIHCKRDPTDCAHSILMAALRPQTMFAETRDSLRLCFGEYRRLMDHVCAVLPPDRILDVHYESLVTNPEQEIRRLLNFCGVDFQPACLSPERNTRIVQTASLWQARQPIHAGSIGRSAPYKDWLGSFGG